MLVLSRHENEAIIINGNIRVLVVDIRGDKVRLGVEAARSIPVHREEVQRKVEAEVEAKAEAAAPFGESTIGDGSEGV